MGRGALAGPVIATAVILPQKKNYDVEITDSKFLSPNKLLNSSLFLKNTALTWGVGSCSAQEIDKTNINKASLLAMIKAVKNLNKKPNYILIDGKFNINTKIFQQTLIKGDSYIYCISAASILAKSWRDQIMKYWDKHYPIYKFSINKGYATKEHLRNIDKFGTCPLHRKSYRPILQQSFNFIKK